MWVKNIKENRNKINKYYVNINMISFKFLPLTWWTLWLMTYITRDNNLLIAICCFKEKYVWFKWYFFSQLKSIRYIESIMNNFLNLYFTYVFVMIVLQCKWNDKQSANGLTRIIKSLSVVFFYMYVRFMWSS